MVGLEFQPALSRPELLAGPVVNALAAWPEAAQVEVAEIDPGVADTAAFCARYGVAPDESVNCVVVAARRAGHTAYAACMVTAAVRADVNGVVRRHLDARKASFAPMQDVLEATAMDYGGITPIGLPTGWPVLVDPAAAGVSLAIIGSGTRRSKLRLPGSLLTRLPGAEVLEGLGVPDSH